MLRGTGRLVSDCFLGDRLPSYSSLAWLGRGWGCGARARERTPQPGQQAHLFSLLLFQGSAPILVAMVILLNIGVAILFINFFI